ncbi:hypothetical protein LTR36_005592 [Oleoguttula mirabilis]|uniref:RING-type domain-containing protein n=1 Tax=Oleoguttula mirabilis TaxID=1507867 RepID=A0AAV9JFB1_9PEZI|nr:hypothetical protein LTR36_005592 [Oleoguttula mirabilis]
MLEHEHTIDRQPSRTSPDASYLQDVLRLPAGKTEEQMDAELRADAKVLGVDTDALAQHEPRAPLASAFSSGRPRRSQESVTSKGSRSTGLVSSCSDTSREQPYQSSRGWSRASLSFRDYDAFLARGLANGRQSMSFSPPSTPSQSTLSLPLSSPESSPRRHFRRIRGLSMLRSSRGGSSNSLNDTCPHCPQDMPSQRRAVHKLPCGHRLCTQALRNTIKAATESAKGAIPSCCGIPLPGKLVEHVMTQAEQGALLGKLDQWDEAASVAPSVTSERRASTTSRRQDALSSDSRTVLDEPKAAPLAAKLQHDLDRVMERSDFKALRQEQAEQRDRFLIWVQKRRAEVEAHHEQLPPELKSRHEAAVEEMLEAHNAATSEAEDKQVKAEADMRQAQSQEGRDNATALKHMEAYCAGIYRTGEPHNRTITEQDLAELEKTRRIRDQMDAKHESAINVLRGEQGRRMKLRCQRQDREVLDLRKTQIKEELDLELKCAQELHQLDDGAAEKKRCTRLRWQIQNAMLVKQYESEAGVLVRGRLPSVEWLPDNAFDSAAVPGATSLEHLESGKAGISTGFAMRGTACSG